MSTRGDEVEAIGSLSVLKRGDVVGNDIVEIILLLLVGRNSNPRGMTSKIYRIRGEKNHEKIKVEVFSTGDRVNTIRLWFRC